MNARHVAWARQHDWFEDAALIDGAYIIGVVESGNNLHADGTTSTYTEYLTFNDFDELYAWAGY